MARTKKQAATRKKLVAEEAELCGAIGQFIYWFSQLEFTIKARLANALELDDGLFDTIIAPYDFVMLCNVTENVLRQGAEADQGARITDYFKRCKKLNQEARVIVAHGSWTLDGVRHVSRNNLRARFHFESPAELQQKSDIARKLINELFRAPL